MDEDNDGRFPANSPVEVRYPRSKQGEQVDPCCFRESSEIRPCSTSPSPASGARRGAGR